MSNEMHLKISFYIQDPMNKGEMTCYLIKQNQPATVSTPYLRIMYYLKQQEDTWLEKIWNMSIIIGNFLTNV